MLILNKDGTIIGNSESWMELSESDLRGVSFQKANIAGGNLSDANLERANFSEAFLYGTYFYRANCMGCDFSGAICQGVVFDEVNFMGANFTGSQLLPDNMGTPCSMRGANLKHVRLDNAILSKCEYDSETIFPPGFDPVSRGMIQVN